MWRNILFIIALFLVACGQDVRNIPNSSNHIYITWVPLEPDKCASAWLIKHFVDKDAHFRLMRKGEVIDQGTSFDVPGAKFMRTHDQTTYESIVSFYKINNRAVTEIGKIVHAIEIDYWREADGSLAISVNNDLNDIIGRSGNDQQALEKTFAYFDHLYLSLKS